MRPGFYMARIKEHGTDRSASGIPFVYIAVEAFARMEAGTKIPLTGASEEGTCRVFLGGGNEQKSQTAIRMARQALRLCGFDPDVQEVAELDYDQHLLAGHEIPIRVKETPNPNGGFYENWDIVLPRGLTKNETSPLTAALRGAKAVGEAPVAGMDDKGLPTDPAQREAMRKALDSQPKLDDIPFGWLLTITTLALAASGLA